MKRRELVTQGNWSVSTTSPVVKHGLSGCELHVFQFHGNLLQKGDGYGKWFPTTELASQWALEHGYLQVFRQAWCLKHRVRHNFLGHRTGFCPSKKDDTLQAQYVPIWKVRQRQERTVAA